MTLVEAQQYSETPLEALTGQVAALTRAVQTLVNDIEELKDPSLEAF
jgi:hypothetical protein